MGLSKTDESTFIYTAKPMRAEQSWVLFQWPDRYSGDVIHNHTAYP